MTKKIWIIAVGLLVALGAAFAAFRSSHSFSVATITQPFPLHAF